MKRFYYGWWIVAAAFVANMIVKGATYSSFGLFVLPVSKEYNLSRADMNTAMILFYFGSAAIAPFLGRLIDVLPARRILILGAVMLGACFAGLSLFHSVLLSAFIFAIPLSIAVLAIPQITLPLLINRWFVAQRGRAMALAVMGASLGLLVVAPLVGLLIERYGWRNALLTMAVVAPAILLALVIFIRDRPGPGDVEGGKQPPATVLSRAQTVPPIPGSPRPGSPMKMSAILRMPTYWSLVLGTSLGSSISMAMGVSLVPIAIGQGLTTLQAGGLISISGMASVATTLSLAAIADTFDRATLLASGFALGAVSCAALLLAPGYPALVGTAAVLGVWSGSIAPLTHAIMADRIGASSFGTAVGLMSPFMAVVMAATLRFAGEVFDRSGGYQLMYLVFAALLIVAAFLLIATRFIRKPDGLELASAVRMGANS